MTNNKIYQMDLHEVIEIDKKSDYLIPFSHCFRVASGWVYCVWDGNLCDYKNHLFVPYDNKFQANLNKEE